MKILLLAMLLAYSPDFPVTVTVVQAEHEGTRGHGFGNYVEDGSQAGIIAFEYSYEGCRVVDVTRRGEFFQAHWDKKGALVIRVPNRLLAPDCRLMIEQHLNHMYVLGKDGKAFLKPL